MNLDVSEWDRFPGSALSRLVALSEFLPQTEAINKEGRGGWVSEWVVLWETEEGLVGSLDRAWFMSGAKNKRHKQRCT